MPMGVRRLLRLARTLVGSQVCAASLFGAQTLLTCRFAMVMPHHAFAHLCSLTFGQRLLILGHRPMRFADYDIDGAPLVHLPHIPSIHLSTIPDNGAHVAVSAQVALRQLSQRHEPAPFRLLDLHSFHGE